jgi:tetratricopeptide (TPR) repeat protein
MRDRVIREMIETMLVDTKFLWFVQHMPSGASAAIGQADVGVATPAAHAADERRDGVAAAVADLTRALACNPYDAAARECRGRCYQALGEHQRAIADFGQLLATGGGSYHTLIDRAQSYIALDRLGPALIDCEIAVRQLGDGDDERVYQLRGYVLFRLGDLYGALGDLSRAIGLGAAEAYFWRGLVYRALGDGAAADENMAAFALRHPAGVAPALSAIAGELYGITPIRLAA